MWSLGRTVPVLKHPTSMGNPVRSVPGRKSVRESGICNRVSGGQVSAAFNKYSAEQRSRVSKSTSTLVLSHTRDLRDSAYGSSNKPPKNQ